MARITVDLSKGIFEVEGSEEFVEKRFIEFQPQLVAALKTGTSPDTKKLTVPSEKPAARTNVRHVKKVGVPEAFSSLGEIPLKLSNGLAYSKLKKPQDRLLWVLALAKELNIEGLMKTDVVWLTDELGSGIANNHVSIHFKRLRTKGYANQSTQTGAMRTLDDGLVHLDTLFVSSDSIHG